jgi:predicted small lipoprotein YifL
MRSSRLCIVGSLLALCACGQKGALYLPEPTRAVVPVNSTGAAASAAPATPDAPAVPTTKDKESDEQQSGTGTP